MAKTELLQERYSRVVRDIPRHQLPPGAVWMLKDYLPANGAPLRKRGGWGYGSPALTGATTCEAVAYAAFSAGAQRIAIDNRGHVFQITDSTQTDWGAAAVPTQRPVLFNDTLIIPGASVYKYTGAAAPSGLGAGLTDTTVLSITGTPTGGTFKIRLWPTIGPHNGPTTGTIAYNASAANVKTALDALSTDAFFRERYVSGSLTVTCTGGPLPGSAVTITATATSTTDGSTVGIVSPFAINSPAFTGGSSPAASFAVTAAAAAQSGSYAAAYKSRLVLAAPTGATNKIYFSAVLDAENWDTAAYFTATYPITGIAAMKNMILIFSASHVERLLGSTPPSSAGNGTTGDFQLDPLFDEGCIDARSIVVHEDKVIWASETGVYISDGSALDDLAYLGGMSLYWRDLMRQSSTWSIAAGLIGNYYVLCARGSGVTETWLIDPKAKQWIQITNVSASMFAEAPGVSPELYFGVKTAARVGSLSGIFAPVAGNKSDADGTAVTPTLETVFYQGNPGSRRWKNLQLGVDIASTDSAYLKVEYVTTPEATTYTTVTDDAGATWHVPTTTGYSRQQVPLRVAASGIGFKITQVGTSSDTMLFAAEAEVHEREQSR